MTDDVASIGGLFASEMGNNESRESEGEDNNDVVASNDEYTTAVAAGGAGRIVDEEEVIHYAAAAEQLLASSSLAGDMKQKKKKRKRKQKEEEELVEERVEEPVVEMSVASAVAAAAAALKEKAAAVSAQSQAAPPPPPPPVAPEVAVVGGAEKKKRRKKKNRQTSQEEESAQALLALNKGGLGSSEGAENEQAVVDEKGEPQVVVATPTKKRKKRTKKQQADEVVVEEDSVPTAPSETINQDGDVDMADTLPVSFADTTGVQASVANENDIATVAPIDQTGLQQMEIPDQRIITEHLAAHMAKIAPPEPSAEDMLVEQRLMNELGNIHQSIEGFVSVNHTNHIGDGDHQLMGPTPNNKTAAKKRKRLPDNHNSVNAPMNELVDPQLMQLDQQAALAAGGDAAVDNAKGRKRRRATTISVPVEGEETAEAAAKKTNRRRTVAPGESKSSWGTTPAGNNGEAVNGGTFSLEERFVIDKALQDYCKVHDMTMDELKDRVWGNNRRKDEFWDTICSAVPNRSRASVYKHVRRSCHIFQQRAKWTAEEDNELADLVKEKGNKWKDIGEAMGRMGEDCRDRYRNYVKCGKDRGTDRWSEEEEKLLKKTVAEHKEISRQMLMSQGKPMPPPEEEDNVLINWTTVSDQMENKRSRIQCRYKWKKMLAQKEKFKQAPIGVTYIGGKKKRLTFDIRNMTAGDRQWLLYQIRDSGATQENEIPWDQIAKNDKDVGIWTHKDLKSAYKGFRSHIPHKRRPLSEVIKQLLQELEQQYTPEARQQRFIPDPNATAEDAANTAANHPSASHSPAPDAGASISPTNFEHQIFQMVTGINAAGAPVASMVAAQNSFQPPQPQQQQQQQQQHSIPTTTADMMVDPELMGQGMDELQKMAGEALNAHSNGLHMQQQQQDGEDENERELRKRLGGFIQGSGSGLGMAMQMQGPA